MSPIIQMLFSEANEATEEHDGVAKAHRISQYPIHQEAEEKGKREDEDGVDHRDGLQMR